MKIKFEDSSRKNPDDKGKLEALREALKEGEDSGSADYSLDDLLAELDSKAYTAGRAFEQS